MSASAAALLVAIVVSSSGCAPDQWVDSTQDAGPVVLQTDPYLGEENVLVDKVIRVTFDEHLDGYELKNNRVLLKSGSTNLWMMTYYDPVDRRLVA